MSAPSMARPAGCPLCAPVRAALAPGESVRCTACDGPALAPGGPLGGSLAGPGHSGPARRPQRPTGDLARDLALVLADLDVLERWLHRAGRELAGGLGSMQGRAGVGAGLDYQGDGSGLLSRWDASDPACRALLWRALEGAAEGLPGPERVRDPDWTRARELERRLRAVPGEAARVLYWLAGHATPESTLGELAGAIGWTFASVSQREAWVEAGVVKVQEEVRRRAGRPRAVVAAPRVAATPRDVGSRLLKAAVSAWFEAQ